MPSQADLEQERLRGLRANYRERYGFADTALSQALLPPGVTPETVADLARLKREPTWLRTWRQEGLAANQQQRDPDWGPDLSRLDLSNLLYYARAAAEPASSLAELPAGLQETFSRLGLTAETTVEAAGTYAQYDRDVVYHHLDEHWQRQGVLLMSPEEAVQRRPDLLRRHLGHLAPAGTSRFAALNQALWSGGAVVYIPRGVRVTAPIHCHFRMNHERLALLGRTLIIAEEDSFVHFVEGCTAASRPEPCLHASVSEVYVGPRAHVRVSVFQNWSDNVYNLVTERAEVAAGGLMEWVDVNLGARLTMKYPALHLVGPGARGEVLSVGFAGAGQHQDTGGKAIHAAPATRSRIVSKSISRDGGRSSYRGLCAVAAGCPGAVANVTCDALLLDDRSQCDTYPTMTVEERQVSIGHEASVSRIGEEQIFYLRTRGLDEHAAMGLVVRGFLEPVAKELPIAYAAEMEALINLRMAGSVG